MAAVINVLIADDHTIVRSGVRLLLEAEPDIHVVGEALDAAQPVALALNLNPNVVLMDIAMPLLNGLEATRQIKREYPEINVLVLTMYDHEEYFREMLEVGASGYIIKRAAATELVSAIRAVYNGEAVLSPAITRLLLEDYLSRETHREDDDPNALSAREREVLQLIAEGKSTKDIAFSLDVSIKTIETHRQNIMKKLGAKSVAELTKYAIKEGLTTL